MYPKNHMMLPQVYSRNIKNSMRSTECTKITINKQKRSDKAVDNKYIADTIDSILQSIMNDKDEPLVEKSFPFDNESGYCTEKLQSFISEPLDNRVEMHMLSWEVIMMSTATASTTKSCIDNEAHQASTSKRKRENKVPPGKFSNLCALGEDQDRLEMRRCKPKRHHDFQKQKNDTKTECSSLYRNSQLPSLDWGHFIGSPIPEMNTSNCGEFSIET